MRRIRVALAGVSLAVLGLVAVLAWRANQGLAAERAVRHEAVAERAFEEMERVLSGFLAREEERPFEHYAPGRGERSPLAAGLPPFVVGAFQRDPQGVVTTPFDPADAGDDRRLAEARVRRAVGGVWPAGEVEAFGDADPLRRNARREPDAAERAKEEAGRFDREPSRKRALLEQAPGTTRVLAGPGVDAVAEAAAEAPASAPEQRNAFDLLESLNRSADHRAERKQKVAEAPKSVVYGGRVEALAEAEPGTPAEAHAPDASGAFALESGPALAMRDAAEEDAFEEGALASDAADPAAVASLAAPRAASPAPRRALGLAQQEIAAREAAPGKASPDDGAVRIAIDPMVGVALGEDLVLYRTALVDQRGWRQGLVLDRAALGAWLDERVIAASGLAGVASVSFADAPADAGADRYVFAHRFAEPFDALRATLVLAPLPGVASPAALYGLVAVLLAAGAAGLVAVHRTASVVVSYAERRSNFVAAVTHELKTPLTAIRMYAEMLRDGLVPGDGKREEYYATITDESERLSRLVDNVLEFSKLEGGRRELSISVGAVGPVLEEAAEKLRAHATREGFEIAVAVAPDLPAVRFDRDALLQVLFNLVDNAMKYAKTSDRRRVELEARREGEAVAISVRDFGPGVASAHRDRIFEPFYRGESELTRTAKGTGIGLALVKELAERMGAAVAGQNAEDGGFRVRLAFPCP